MAKACTTCEKTSRMGGKRKLLRAHYNPVKWERKYPNLQWATLASGVRAKLCTKCIKKGKHLAGAGAK
ncbi:MAG: hypothetical protein A2756_05810 [Candidatus Ryanbacteria bacterium RIFCSPHIGHO2_01_FULL_48_27]|uniref:50S ribosomal protein L28 n=1 Tax=Candidatus Ryanbacteria bacterium RIFCSPHIGHO2_01_FULL_48_27 TaxID=1802115 RepID=A0A1G2G7F1_9BACT|nr:MAG: hypothetical protein A2756_05810 [Candidatus Ryanbacteria bacterium RIFCSPHIGHO2_01_FULL_48_27]